jgi:hypothetical protein
MCGVCMLGKLGGCSKEASWDKTSWGACECACRVVRQGGADWGLTESQRRDRRTVGRRKGTGRGLLSVSVTGHHNPT